MAESGETLNISSGGFFYKCWSGHGVFFYFNFQWSAGLGLNWEYLVRRLRVPIGSEHHTGDEIFMPFFDPNVALILGVDNFSVVCMYLVQFADNVWLGFGYIVLNGFGIPLKNLDINLTVPDLVFESLDCRTM